MSSHPYSELKFTKGQAAPALNDHVEIIFVKLRLSVVAAWSALFSLISAQQVPLPPAEFERLHALIQPQPGESPWREIEWLTNVTEARQRSIAENKPIVIFTAADGSPLGRT